MKRIVLVSVVLLAFASAAFAQGVVMLYADNTFTQCDASPAPGLFTAYVVHEVTLGAKAVQYQVIEDTGGLLVYVADQNQFPLVIGNSQTGVAVSYGGCFNNQIHVQNVLYSLVGTPAVCTGLTVVNDPLAPTGEIEATDCNDVKTFPNGSFLSFSDDGSCPCGELQTPVEETNWGRVKALYQ
jgi:hypothetical protein